MMLTRTEEESVLRTRGTNGKQDGEAGKKESVDELSEREKRATRKNWRE